MRCRKLYMAYGSNKWYSRQFYENKELEFIILVNPEEKEIMFMTGNIIFKTYLQKITQRKKFTYITKVKRQNQIRDIYILLDQLREVGNTNGFTIQDVRFKKMSSFMELLCLVKKTFSLR